MNEATIAKKQEMVEVVSEKMANAGSTVFVDYLGLTVAEVTDLRIKLRAENCEMKVIKNNILRRAAEKVGYGVDANSLVGPSAAVFSEDEVAASKVLYAFAKEHKITVKSGIVGGVATDAKDLEQLAKLPNKLGMVSMLLSVMQAPVRGLACAIKAVSEKNE